MRFSSRTMRLPVMVFILGMILASGDLAAQEVRNVNGRKHLVHRVQQGQTLYAVSRAYAIDVDDLIKANPGAEQGLSIGQELLIPQDAVNRREARTAPELAKDGELLHTVAKKETLFGIAKKYGIDINMLLQRNPELNSGLREGMVVVIPVSLVIGQSEISMRPAMPERIIEHLVQPGETLYSLSKLYVVTPEAIMAANNGLSEGLKAGSSVRIPLRHGTDTPRPVDVDTAVVDQRYKVGLLLPFSIGRNDSIFQLAQNPDEARFYEPTRIAAQFYAGATMALDSLEKLGLKADVTILDQGDEARIWNSALKRPEIKDMDLFIGPFHRGAIESLARANNRAHIICPVPQSNNILQGHPKIIKVSTGRTDLIRQTARYVAGRYAADNVIVVRSGVAADREAQSLLQRALQEALEPLPQKKRDTVLVVGSLADLVQRISATELNIVVVPSEDVEFVMGVVGKLKPLAAKNRIVLVGMESWLNFDAVEDSDLDLLGFTFAAEHFIDREDPRVKDFMQRFQERHHTEADEYAFLGFDITFYFLKALLTKGPKFQWHLADMPSDPLHMAFRLARSAPENGFKNEAGVMVQQKDLRLRRAP